MNSLLWWQIAVSVVGKETSSWDYYWSVVAAIWFNCLESSLEVALFVWKESSLNLLFSPEDDCSSKLVWEQPWKILNDSVKHSNTKGYIKIFVLQSKISHSKEGALYGTDIYIHIYFRRPRERKERKEKKAFPFLSSFFILNSSQPTWLL